MLCAVRAHDKNVVNRKLNATYLYQRPANEMMKKNEIMNSDERIILN